MLSFDTRNARRAAERQARTANRAKRANLSARISTISQISRAGSPNDPFPGRAELLAFDTRAARFAAELAVAEPCELDASLRKLAEWRVALSQARKTSPECSTHNAWIDDGEQFVASGWALQAIRLGWSETSLWSAPQDYSIRPSKRRTTNGGLTLQLAGRTVRIMDSEVAILSDGARIARFDVAGSCSRAPFWQALQYEAAEMRARCPTRYPKLQKLRKQDRVTLCETTPSGVSKARTRQC